MDNSKPSFPHPNFSDAINRKVVQSEIEGGVHLRDVPPGTVLEVQTQNHLYTIVHKAWGRALISGHPEFCPHPVEVQIHGSTWGGSMIMNHYLGRGMHLEFWHPVHQVLVTSRIVDIRAAARVPEPWGLELGAKADGTLTTIPVIDEVSRTYSIDSERLVVTERVN